MTDKRISPIKEKELYRELIEQSPFVAYVLDEDKNIIEAINLHKSEDIGLSPDHVVVGKNLNHYICDKSSPFHHACAILDKAIDRIKNGEERVTVEYSILDSFLRAGVSRFRENHTLIMVQDFTSIFEDRKESVNDKEPTATMGIGDLSSWNYDVKTKHFSSHKGGRRGTISFYEYLSNTIDVHKSEVITMFDDIINNKAEEREITIQIKSCETDTNMWINLYAKPHLYDKNGEVAIITGSQKDITKEYEYSININELNKQNELVLNNMSSILAYIKPDYKVTWSNTPNILCFDNTKKYYKPNTYCYSTFDRDTPCKSCVMKRAMESGKIETSEFTTPEGLSVEIIANPLINADKKIEGVILRIDNVTEKKKTIQKLKKVELEISAVNRLLHAILDNLPSYLYAKDANDQFKYIMANKKFCEGLGLSESEIIGKTDYDLFPRQAGYHRRQDIETMNSKKAKTTNAETVEIGKRTEIWQTIKIPLFAQNESNKRYLIGIGNDISESYKAFQELAISKKKAEESDRLKSAFLANMSHEIRTPLNAIVGFSELMQSSNDANDKEEYMRIISANNEMLLRLINDILDLSKIESGIVRLEDSEFDLAQHCDELVSTMQQRITNPNVELITVNPYKSCIIKTDKARISQIWNNFMTNAIKYTVSGYIKMGYEYVDGGIKIYVEDSGIGIPEEKRKRLFHRFEKLDSFAQGTGLGLSICKAITELGGGKIGFEPTAQNGSLFWSWKPLEAKITY